MAVIYHITVSLKSLCRANSTEVRLYKTLIRPVVTYGAET